MMPDILMCNNEDCPVRTRCYRSPASGTEPHERQAWIKFEFHPEAGCGDFISAFGEPLHIGVDLGHEFKGAA